MKAITQLDEDFAGVDIVRAAEGEAVVEEHAAVGDVDALEIDREALGKLFAEGQIKSGVRLKMVARSERWLTAVAKAGRVIDVCGGIRMPRQAVLAANVERVPLVVVE